MKTGWKGWPIYR
jgi:hypothetical protein